MAKLLLWDIDGTLITPGGAGRDALCKTLEKRYNIFDDLKDVKMAGRTDRAIINDICRKYDQLTFNGIKETYLKELKKNICNNNSFVPKEILDFLDKSQNNSELYNCLLTGNMEEASKIKLSFYNIDKYFMFGIFGEKSEERNELGALAIKEIPKKLNKTFKNSDVWIIGDTPSDITCAKSNNIKSIAVASGSYSFDKLKECNPDILYKKIPDYSEVISNL